MGDRRRLTWFLSPLLLTVGCGTAPPPHCVSERDCRDPTNDGLRVVVPADPGPVRPPPAADRPDEPPSEPEEQAITVAVPAGSGAKGPFPVSNHPDLRAPLRAARTAPQIFQVRFDTTRGQVDVDCNRAWAPHGADRLFSLVTVGYFDDVAFFRTVAGFVAQFGIHGLPDVHQAWKQVPIPPDPVTESNLRGRLTFAQAGRPAMPGHTADNRTTQLFFNFKDNPTIDRYGFAPVCQVVRGMDVLEALHTGYGEQASRNQATIRKEGNTYLRKTFPALDYIIQARVISSQP